MKKILVAGATGYLGGYIVKQLKAQNYWVRVLVRNKKQADMFEGQVDDIFMAQVTEKASLDGIMTDIDMVISSIGITRQRDNMTYIDVDYRANLNLLEIAEANFITQFLYISVINAEKLAGVKLIDAKEKFVARLKRSNIASIIIRPNGFFSDMLEILNMARAGRGWLIGDGMVKISPISGSDLAEKCVEYLERSSENNAKNWVEYEIGGPQSFTITELYQLAFKIVGKPVKITAIPLWLVKPFMFLLCRFTSVTFYGPIEFFVSGMTMNDPHQGVLCGKQKLEDFFKQSL